MTNSCQLVCSQILAEFDFPASGIGKLASSIPLPLVPDAGTDPRNAQHQFFFLALISMRKLLNRILYHLYIRSTYHLARHLECNVYISPSRSAGRL